jgi:hypothetical protein
MPIEISWHDEEEKVLLYEFSGKWTWDEAYAVHSKGEAMAKSKPYTIYVMAITTDRIAHYHIPPGSISHLSNLSRLMSDNSALAVIVTQNGLWLALDSAVSRVSKFYRDRIRFVRTIEDAYKLFEEKGLVRQPKLKS